MSEKSSRRERVARALADPIYFGEMYVRPYDEGWVEALPPFADDMVGFMLSHRRGAVVMPPEFLKTTLGSQVLPLWLTYRYTWAGVWLRGMLLSEEEGMSQANLSVVSWHIENNPQLAADFADDDGNPMVMPDPDENVWREDAIIVRRHGASKDPTWQAKGLDSKGIHGRRLDWLIGDDVVTPKNAFSPALRRQALRTWDMQITTRVVKTGRAIVLGNFNHERDLTSTLAARPTYAVFRRPAVHVRGDPSKAIEPDHSEAEPLWPSNWPIARLKAEQRDKPNMFRRIFLLDPRAEQGDKLLVDWLTIVDPSETPTDECRYVIALDPAAGGEQDDLDFFNISVFAGHGAHLDLVFSLDFRRTIPDQVRMVGLVHDRWNRVGSGVVAIGGAKQAMDAYMRGALEVARPDLTAKVQTVSIKGHKDERLEALGPYAKSGWLRVWATVADQLTSDPEDQYQELTLIEQWREFPNGKHDDKLDGLDVGIRTWNEHGAPRDVTYDLAAA